MYIVWWIIDNHIGRQLTRTNGISNRHPIQTALNGHSVSVYTYSIQIDADDDDTLFDTHKASPKTEPKGIRSLLLAVPLTTYKLHQRPHLQNDDLNWNYNIDRNALCGWRQTNQNDRLVSSRWGAMTTTPISINGQWWMRCGNVGCGQAVIAASRSGARWDLSRSPNSVLVPARLIRCWFNWYRKSGNKTWNNRIY